MRRFEKYWIYVTISTEKFVECKPINVRAFSAKSWIEVDTKSSRESLLDRVELFSFFFFISFFIFRKSTIQDAAADE